MPEKAPKSNDPYLFDPTFERGVVTLCAMSSKLWGRIGHALDPECVGSASSKLVLRACRQIALETHRGPESLMTVLQHLRRWMDEGKTPLTDVRQVAEFFDDAMDAGLPSEDAAVAGVKPFLQRRLKNDAMKAAIEEYGKDGDFGNVTKLINKANRLGDSNTSVGIRLGSGSYEEIEKVRTLEKHGTGIWELDTEVLDGGMRRGCLGIFLGASGDGKSMALSHVAGYSLTCGLFVLYATLEVTPADVLARVKANLTGMPINAILEEPRLVEPLLSKMPLGPFLVQEFTPQATTMEDLEEWVTACEEQIGRQVDVLVTDYGDKLVAPKGSQSRGDDHGYSQGRAVFERMRIYANEGHKGGKIWHWTACQATRQEKKRAKSMTSTLDLNDMADSLHKARVADLVISINPRDNGIKWAVPKNRHGKKGATEELPSDFAVGRVSPIMIEPNDTMVTL